VCTVFFKDFISYGKFIAPGRTQVISHTMKKNVNLYFFMGNCCFPVGLPVQKYNCIKYHTLITFTYSITFLLAKIKNLALNSLRTSCPLLITLINTKVRIQLAHCKQKYKRHKLICMTIIVCMRCDVITTNRF